MTKIKICGLSRLCDIEAANAIKPDYIGFVFAEKSRRFVTHLQAAALRARLLPEIPAVGVFVDAKIGEIVQLAEQGIIRYAQLHGHEDAAYIAALREACSIPIIQAFRVSSREDVCRAVTSPAEQILLDSGAGTGQIFDWSLLQGLDRPFFLAGGLTPENVCDAISAVQPEAVDLSSGVETDGRKDFAKMRAFADAVRGAHD